MHRRTTRRPIGASLLPKPFVFDQPLQSEAREAKMEFLRRVVAPWKSELRMNTALDLGCGVGYFSAMLRNAGLQVTAVDGRTENIEEARNRHPGVDFRVADAEDPSLVGLGTFDLVFCFGLLYHLENPLRAIRHLHAMTNNLLLMEGVIFPGDEPGMVLIDEFEIDDQGLKHIAFYPTEAGLVKMFYRAG